MGISTSISRLIAYYKRHGFAASLGRFGLAAKRTVFSSRMVLFYCDLSTVGSPISEMPSDLKVERHRSQSDIAPQDLQEITSVWSPDLARRNVDQRFELGASLWLLRFEDTLAGYGWTLQGRTVEPHYFRLGPRDIHFFDFHVFSKYRGRGLNPLLVNHILRNVAAQCQGRAFIEAAEWNQAQLASLKKTPFHRLNSARKITIFGRTIVCWAQNQELEQQEEIPQETRLDTTEARPARVADPRDRLQSTEAQ